MRYQVEYFDDPGVFERLIGDPMWMPVGGKVYWTLHEAKQQIRLHDEFDDRALWRVVDLMDGSIFELNAENFLSVVISVGHPLNSGKANWMKDGF